MTDRPNILLFITDQLRADHLGCYGNRTIRTPAINSLAARGKRIDRRRTDGPVAVAAEVVGAELVGDEEEDVGTVGHSFVSRGTPPLWMMRAAMSRHSCVQA